MEHHPPSDAGPREGSTKGARRRHVTIVDGKAGLPYSKGLMATSIMASGLVPQRAFAVAEEVEATLHATGRSSVTEAELTEMCVEVLTESVGPRYAENYRRWRIADARTVPLVVLIGGATGVGKSTVATTVAGRLGIVRITSSDAVREVMRGIVTAEMVPALHASTFEVHRLVTPASGDVDPVIAGFRAQVQAVAVGLDKIIRRAVLEGTDVIVEGAHVVPGALSMPSRHEAIVAQMVIAVSDEHTHASHFAARAASTRGRDDQRYLSSFEDIRAIQRYVRDLAVEHGVPVISSHGLDATVARVMEQVVSAATDAPPRHQPTALASEASAPEPDPVIRHEPVRRT